MNWLRKKLIKWLGVDKKIKNFEAQTTRLETKVLRVQSDQDFINQAMRIGADVHFRSKSWAVICLEGRPDFVKLVEFSETELRELRRFLQEMERRGAEVRVDTFLGSELIPTRREG